MFRTLFFGLHCIHLSVISMRSFKFVQRVKYQDTYSIFQRSPSYRVDICIWLDCFTSRSTLWVNHWKYDRISWQQTWQVNKSLINNEKSRTSQKLKMFNSYNFIDDIFQRVERSGTWGTRDFQPRFTSLLSSRSFERLSLSFSACRSCFQLVISSHKLRQTEGDKIRNADDSR